MQVTRPQIMDPVAAYDLLAADYQSHAQERSRYLRKVEDLVIARSHRAHAVLDVGAGDGRRALRIAQAIEARRLVLAEPSAAMRARCPANVEIWNCRASELPSRNSTFDVITCLWNVLGHLDGAEERIRALAGFKSLLNPGGAIFVDVNHRYNAAAYGWIKTAGRIVHDTIIRSESHGDVVVRWRAGNRDIVTRGHVFRQSELRRLFRAAGLKVTGRWVVDYRTGAERRWAVMGNLVYELKLPAIRNSHHKIERV